MLCLLNNKTTSQILFGLVLKQKNNFYYFHVSIMLKFSSLLSFDYLFWWIVLIPNLWDFTNKFITYTITNFLFDCCTLACFKKGMTKK